MALSSSEEVEESTRKNKTHGKRKRASSSAYKVTPTPPRPRTEHDDSEPDSRGNEETEEGMGVVEPRPLNVTSWKEKVVMEVESGDDRESEPDSEEPQTEATEVDGRNVTLQMVENWVHTLEKSHSLHSLRLLCGSLHAAMVTIFHQDKDGSTPYSFVVKDSIVFNAIVAACFQHISPALNHHFPQTASSTSTKPCLPSVQPAWTKVRRTVKQYLYDLLSLAETLQDIDMQRAVLKQVHIMAPFYVCLPKILKLLNKCLIEKWSTADSHIQVLAFLALRRIVLHQAHPALHVLLKKVYMAFVRNCKFSSPSTLPGIRFMSSSLVELLSLDPPTSYQHGFVYIRQLAIHLRTALTSGKKEAQQVVYNWQFVHCLHLWSQVLSQVTHQSMRPLLYPLVQTLLGTLQVQPSPKYHPLRLHLLKMLLQLAVSTDTHIPMAPYLVEVMEVHGVEGCGGGKLQSGKPPDLSTLLRATKQQLATRSFRTALLNEAYLLMLQYFSGHAHYIGFPELVYPTVVRIRKVSKTTPYSWLRAQLKQLLEKVEEVSKEIAKDRASVTFSPVNFDLLTLWENQRKGRENSISQFLSTWTKFHCMTDHNSTPEESHIVQQQSTREDSDEDAPVTDDEDIIQNLELNSDSD